MSKSYFLRLFRRYMGTTPYNYLVNFRITQAKELLVLTDHKMCIRDRTGMMSPLPWGQLWVFCGAQPLKRKREN